MIQMPTETYTNIKHSLNGVEKDPVMFNDWHVVASLRDLPPETLMPFRLLDTDLVIWRGKDTPVQVWEDRCPHRSVRLSAGKVVGNGLACSYHGMVYGADGRCIRVPAHPNYLPPKQACTKTFQVQEHYGLVYVCLGEPEKDPAPFPEWDEPDYRCYLTGPHFIRSNAFRAIENFLDVAHFPFIHDGILGEADKPEIEDYTVVINEDGVYAQDVRVWQPDPYGTGEGASVSYDYWALRPLTAYLKKHSPTGESMTLLYHVTPVSEEECVAWMSGALNYGHEISDEEICAFQDRVILQDLGNLESHAVKKLPLNAPIEFHVPSDRATLMYRKWLKQMGLRYGTI